MGESAVTNHKDDNSNDDDEHSTKFVEDVGASRMSDSDTEDEEDPIEDSESEEGGASKGKVVMANSAEGKKLLKKVQQKKSAAGPTGVGSLFGLEISKSSKDDPVQQAEISSPVFNPEMFCLKDYRVGDKDVKYLFLSDCFDRIDALKGSGHSSKKKAMVILTNLLRVLIFHNKEDLVHALYLCINKVAPDYEGVELGVGDALLIDAISEMSGRTRTHIKRDFEAMADLGSLAMCSRHAQKCLFQPKPLTTKNVLNSIRDIAKCSGHESQRRRKDKIKNLLVASKGSEPKYIVRTLQARLGIGIATNSIISALGGAFALTRPEGIADTRLVKNYYQGQTINEAIQKFDDAVRAAMCQCPNIEKIVNHLLEGGSADILLSLCQVEPGVPVKPMLAHPTKGIQEVFDRFSNCRFTCEYKYDGERAQIHVLQKDDGTTDVRIYSRNTEDMTLKYPDVVAVIRSNLKKDLKNCILDCEVTAFDSVSQTILPFQRLSARKRKDVTTENISIQTKLYPFDCIFYNDHCLIKEPLHTRRKRLRECLNEDKNNVEFAEAADLDNIEGVEQFLDGAIKASCEGLMVKSLDSNATYEPSKRSLCWLKIKKDYLEGMTDSIDAVPIGAYFGKGKRAGVYGAYLLAVYSPSTEEYETLCKIGTGFSDEALEQHFNFLTTKAVSAKPCYYRVHEKLTPDVWFEPAQVWECKGADLSISPVHTAGITLREDEKGIGIRFPRFLRFRDDKAPEDTTTANQVLDMYFQQFQQ